MVAAVAARPRTPLVAVDLAPGPRGSGAEDPRASPDANGGLPELAERQRAVVDLVGVDCLDAQNANFRALLTGEVERLFNDVVLRCVRPVWADVDEASFLAKWRGGFDLYCSLALSCIVCSARRPVVVDVASRVFSLLGLDEGAIARVSQQAIPLVFRVLETGACRRAALVSAWILVLDEALDEGLDGVALADRPAVLSAAMRGQLPPTTTPELRAVHAIGAAIRQTVRRGRDRRADAAALARVVDDVERWARCEVDNLMGVPDPHGVSHRTIGITASMDLLGWAVSRQAGPKEHQFLYRVAELGQMVDDWLDVDKDRAQGRDTPATAGVWNIETMASTYQAAETLLHELQDDAGEPVGAFRRLLHRTFRGQIQHMTRCLVENP